MKKLFTLLGALLLGQAMAVAQNYLHISQGDSAIAVPIAQLDSATVRDAGFYNLLFTPEGLDGLHYVGQEMSYFGDGPYTFNVTLVKGDGNTMYIHNLDPYFAQYGYVADLGYNILKGTLVTADDGQTATLTCEAGQPMGYGKTMFVVLEDLAAPIVFTLSANLLTCTTGYGVYDEGFYNAFSPFTLHLGGATRAPQSVQQLRGMNTPKLVPPMKGKTINQHRTIKQEGKATDMQLQPMNSREITQ
ncbi:MAG: hypothetical protein J6S11_08360 [Bacteroidaceae bacterium]|nr:hypothetical protein [Bacteroidaceae bacterium]